MSNPTVILDFDRSVGAIPDAVRIPLREWQETIRYGCSLRQLKALGRTLDANFPTRHGTVLFGSGDYHHLSYLLLSRLAGRGPFQLVVFDNHPDNMRFPFGIHCGSWVYWASRLPFVSHVHVVGITSSDVSGAHWWENHLRALSARRLTYWCMDVDTRWARRLGMATSFQVAANPDELLERFAARMRQKPEPTYISIDKDVLSAEVVQTNWDQGRLLGKHLHDGLGLFAGRLVGSDINGEVSAYQYRTWWKRRLSAADGQAPEPESTIAAWQPAQTALDLRLLERFQSLA
ncbi:MAG: hypothetical protein ACM3SV_07485 [Betaproteobacteria bacterium]